MTTLSIYQPAQPRRLHPRIRYEDFDPLRSPAWRSDIVESVVREKRTQRRGMDAWMKRFANFLQRWSQLRTQEERLPLFDRFPDIYYAYTWHHHGDNELVAQLNAWILTGLPLSKVAEELQLYLPAVEAYEALFFNVLDRIDNTTYILRQVLGVQDDFVAAGESLLNDKRRQACYQVFGYFGGPEALYMTISGFGRRSRPSGDRVPEWFDQSFKTLLRRTSVMAVHSMDVKPHNVMRLIELNLKSVEIEQNARLAEGNTTGPMKDVCEIAEKLLHAVKWGVGNSGLQEMPPAARMLHESAYGLTASESNRLAAGEELPELQAAARRQRLPSRKIIEHDSPKKKDD